MKHLLIALFLTLPQLGEAATCYRAEAVPSKSNLPEEICLYSWEVKSEMTPTYHTFTLALDTSLGKFHTVSKVKNQNGYTIVLSKNLKVERNGVCESYYRSVFQFQVEVDVYGFSRELTQISGLIESTPDQCHTPVSTVEIPYSEVH